MKKEDGFTLAEVIIAIFILVLISVVVFKSFLVSAKIAAKTYERDKANVIAVNTLEYIKKDPIQYLQKNKKNEIVEFYDAQWNKVEQKNAQYKVISKIDDKDTRDVNLDCLEPETSMKDRKYYVTFMGKYLCVLLKNPNFIGIKEDSEEYTGETEYLFYVIYYYDEKEYKKEWDKVDELYYNGKKINRGFKDYLSNKSKADDYSAKSSKELYEFLDDVRVKKAGMHTEGEKTSDCNSYSVYEVGDAVSVRMDFDKDSDKDSYTVDVYNMADKPMNLYMVHGKNNNSALKVSANGGYVNEAEVDINKKIDKTLYDISVEVQNIKDKTSLVKKQTKKYLKYDNITH